ncbi:hypothetical protein S40288_05628 [Stachybotrys chartarum IBT 40288]|nr:hypothetical protein S40288_05628 [Stachybotrys chartarum IBT 40288]
MLRIRDPTQRRDDLQDRDKARNVRRQGDEATPTNDSNAEDDPATTQRPPPMASRVVEFEESSFEYARALSGDTRYYDISWITNLDATITYVEWSRVDSDTQQRIVLDSVEGLRSGPRAGTRGLLSNVDEGGATLAASNAELHEFYGDEMYIEVRWIIINPPSAGYSLSGNFTVVASEEEAKEENERTDWNDIRGTDNVTSGMNPFPSTQPSQSDSPSSSPPQMTAAPEATSSNLDPLTTSTTSTVAAGNSDENASSSETGSGGLSTGAIAGIAVGASVGLILVIALLVWFFILRPRRKRRMAENTANSSSEEVHRATPALIADKEISRMDDSPHEPYSDEIRPAAMAGSAPRHSQHAGADATYTPYQHTAPSGSRQDLTRSGANTPQGVPRSVAHLVEDGMTEDEIRRLEEEERQLDDAIERARRR